MEQAANRIRPGAYARRRRDIGVDGASRGGGDRGSGRRTGLAQPVFVRDQGGDTWRRSLAGDTYDLAVLAVPLAFLFRLGRVRGFLSNELAGIGVACLLILIFILPAVKVPVGLVAVVIVAALIARSAFAARSVAA